MNLAFGKFKGLGLPRFIVAARISAPLERQSTVFYRGFIFSVFKWAIAVIPTGKLAEHDFFAAALFEIDLRATAEQV